MGLVKSIVDLFKTAQTSLSHNQEPNAQKKPYVVVTVGDTILFQGLCEIFALMDSVGIKEGPNYSLVLPESTLIRFQFFMVDDHFKIDWDE